MGVQYIDYPSTVSSINEFRRNLIDPAVGVWFQAGTEIWYQLADVLTVRRNSSLGDAFEGRREPIREDGEIEPPTCLKRPITFRTPPTTKGSAPEHLAKIEYSDGPTSAPGVAPDSRPSLQV